MVNSRILSVAEPDLVSYPHLAYPLAVLQAEPDSLRWIYSNFVQLYLSDRGDEMMADFYSPNPFDQFVPILFGSPRLTRNLVRRCFPSFADFVRDSIDNDCSVWTFVDEYYIPGSVAYQNRFNPHGIMIHGYDDGNRLFHVAGFLTHQRFGTTFIHYDDMEMAFNDFEPPESKPYTEYTLLLKPYRNFMKACEFNLQWVMDQLEDYGLAKPSDRRMPAYELRQSSPHVWGMDIYDELRRRAEQVIENKFILDHRPFHVLWEHKKIMNKRIAYMELQGYYSCSRETAEGWRDLERYAVVNINLILKYWMTLDKKHLEQLIDRLGKMKADEARIIEEMLHDYNLRCG
ncbi:hypothetical protein GE107_11705 [Cohnella sp. CFH 77786]|uniref:hypothetical protein n=1 Tax=Cohnella sp. CFH 77786 TaxID=2662265 RepID=UPI001C60F4D5|nr:hypothetical protein [Cohnella sp. CFH 77786]MBW5446726.1 hypothetical protein [Cohnella sp. CFH 77786]